MQSFPAKVSRGIWSLYIPLSQHHPATMGVSLPTRDTLLSAETPIPGHVEHPHDPSVVFLLRLIFLPFHRPYLLFVVLTG